MFPEDLTIPNGAKHSRKNVLLKDDLEKLFSLDQTTYYGNVVQDFLINAYRFAVVTGLRPGECIGVEIKDIVGDKLCLKRSVNVHGEETSGKNNNARRVFKLTPTALDIIEDQLAFLKKNKIKSKYLFPKLDGSRVTYQTLHQNWERYREYNEFNYVTLYELRHTFVSMAKNLPPAYLKSLVGHSKDMDTLGVYGHEMEGEQEEIANMLENNLSKYIKSIKKSVDRCFPLCYNRCCVNERI